MRYCPLCGAAYRDEKDLCANCAAPLVASLDAPDVLENPIRLLWIGGRKEREFDSVAAALREAGIPGDAQQGTSGLLGALFKSESRIYVLQADLDRAAAVARDAITILPLASLAIQTCHACAAECSACLAVCPACKAVLYVEPLAKAGRGENPDQANTPELKYCPSCGAEYSAGHVQCSVCRVDLVSEALRGRPLTEQQKNDRIVVVWRGGDPLAVSEVVHRLREAGIRHHLHATEDHLVFELGMPRPKYAVRVFESDAPRASELLEGVRESLPFGLSFTPVADEEPAAPLQRSSGRWNPATATSEIWSGEDASLADLLEACLRENRIGVRRLGVEPGRLRLFVMAVDEAAAGEIVREIRDGSPLT
jgi:ferredoxin